MTRLSTEMIKDIALSLQECNDFIIHQTGLSLLQIGCEASGLEDKALPNFSEISIGVVPITAGLGKISQFSETVSSILSYLGFGSFVTEQADIAGLSEAYNRKCDLIFAADDDEFIAINTKNNKVVFNYSATADAFVIALDGAVKGIAEKEVLVIGAGKVGNSAIKRLLAMKAKVFVYDVDEVKLEQIQRYYNVKVLKSLDEGVKIKIIYDASPAINIITENLIKDNSVVSCPGVPHGLSPEATRRIKNTNFIHDNLILGVITMALQAITD